jgi:hypothetical protein
MVTLQDIKAALDNGLKVTAHDGYYEIIKDEIGQYLIKSLSHNRYYDFDYVGLHGAENTPYAQTANINLESVTIHRYMGAQ